MQSASMFGCRALWKRRRAMEQSAAGSARQWRGTRTYWRGADVRHDVKVYRRGYHARMIQPPAVFGHEMAGTIEVVGESVTGWRRDDRVVIANSAPCGTCFYCRRNLTELCEDLLFLNGAYAQQINVPARVVQKNMYSVPAHISFEEAALSEPLACVVRGMDEMPVQAGETVVVAGVWGRLACCSCRCAPSPGRVCWPSGGVESGLTSPPN